MAERQKWIDRVKAFACILVVLGHFYQSMVKSRFVSESAFFLWFDQTIYLFHVPLFFICSGFLYQMSRRTESVRGRGKNIARKALNLGVPYFVFSFLIWLMKTLFSGEINTKIGGLWETLFLFPTAPYWYLYTLFFIFLVTPTFRSKKTALAGFGAALVLKILSIAGCQTGIFFVDSLMENEIWFAAGMLMRCLNWKEKMRRVNGVCYILIGAAFLLLSAWLYGANLSGPWKSFLLSLMPCCAVPGWMLVTENRKMPLLDGLSPYTLPVFLMHTMCAAPCRILLMKIGISHPVVQIVVGVVFSFAGPILAARLMKKLKWPEFLLYPSRFIKGNHHDENPVCQ